MFTPLYQEACISLQLIVSFTLSVLHQAAGKRKHKNQNELKNTFQADLQNKIYYWKISASFDVIQLTILCIVLWIWEAGDSWKNACSSNNNNLNRLILNSLKVRLGIYCIIILTINTMRAKQSRTYLNFVLVYLGWYCHRNWDNSLQKS